MKMRQILIYSILLFGVMMLGFPVSGMAAGDGNMGSAVEISVSGQDELFSSNVETLSTRNNFWNNFYTAGSAQRRYTLKITNESRYDIHRIYMSSAETTKWGPDQLEDDILRSGTSLTLHGIVAGEYDIMFIDEDRDKCVLRNIQIFKNTAWTISTNWLVSCQEKS